MSCATSEGAENDGAEDGDKSGTEDVGPRMLWSCPRGSRMPWACRRPSPVRTGERRVA